MKPVNLWGLVISAPGEKTQPVWSLFLIEITYRLLCCLHISWVNIRANIVVLWHKPLLATPTSFIRVLVRVQLLFPTQFPGNEPVKAADDDLSAWVLATHVGDPDVAPSFSQPSPGCCSHWESEPEDGKSLSLCVILHFK